MYLDILARCLNNFKGRAVVVRSFIKVRFDFAHLLNVVIAGNCNTL